MPQTLAPLSALGWFIDARCAPPQRKTLPEDPEAFAAMARAQAKDAREPAPKPRPWNLLARWARGRNHRPRVVGAVGPSDAH